MTTDAEDWLHTCLEKVRARRREDGTYLLANMEGRVRPVSSDLWAPQTDAVQDPGNNRNALPRLVYSLIGVNLRVGGRDVDPTAGNAAGIVNLGFEIFCEDTRYQWAIDMAYQVRDCLRSRIVDMDMRDLRPDDFLFRGRAKNYFARVVDVTITAF